MPVRMLIACLLYTSAMSAGAQVIDPAKLSWSGQIGIASGLVYRGINLNDESLVPNVDVAVEHTSGLYLRGWLTRVDLPRPDYYRADSNTMWQALLGAGYNWRLSPHWNLNLSHSWYRYSDKVADERPDYREWSFSVDYMGLLVLNYARAEELWGQEEHQDAISLDAYWSFNPRLIGVAALGRVEQSGLFEDDYHYLRLNLGYLLSDNWSAQLQYHDSFGVGEVYQGESAQRKLVAQIDWHW